MCHLHSLANRAPATLAGMRPFVAVKNAKLVMTAVLTTMLIGCSAATDATDTADATADREPSATDRCAAPELPPVQAGLHLIGDREPPVAYSSTPPTSGWHRSGVAGPGVAASPLTEPVQVGLLEAGVVVISHGGLTADQRSALAGLAERFPETVAVAPYAPLGEGEVVSAAWGVLQRCSGVDRDVLVRFVEFYGGLSDEAVDHEPTPGVDVPGG